MTEIVRGHFDGIRIRFYDAEDRLVSSTRAVSGRPLAQNPKFQGEKNLGPIPEGEWVISSKVASNWNPFDEDRIQPRESGTIAAWGEYRVALRPLDGTNTHSRTDFYLHGSRDGNGYGSAGCIDVNTDDEALFLQLIANGASEIPITVKYDDRLRNGFHPVFNGDPIFNAYIEVLEAGIPGLFPPTPREDLLDGGYSERFITDGATSEPAAPSLCFLPHTPITLADGTTKPIAAIRPGDMVLSPDKTGTLVPARVTRTFVNDVAHVLDFHGNGVTPGHVFLCGAGRFTGRHVPLIDILRDDGAVVRQDGSLMRASTGCAVGSDGDRVIEVVAADGTRGWVRSAIRLPGEAGGTVRAPDANLNCGVQI